jgi:hypothetical protein
MTGETRTATDPNEMCVRSAKMQFILTGFTPDTGFRVFAFEGIAADRTRTEFTVRTDLSLIRRYGIRVQELPLLCRGLLERRDEGQQERTLTFTEEEMRAHAKSCAAERDAAQRRKSRRSPPPRLAPVGKFHSGNEDARREIVQAGILR